MLQIGILLTCQYRLLSLAAIMDVFETVNKIYKQNDQPVPFSITLLHTAQSGQQILNTLETYPTANIKNTAIYHLLLIPAFNSDNLKQAVHENRTYLPWLKQQYKSGAAIASFCTGAFLLGAAGLLDGKIATTHVDACKEFAAAFPAVQLCADKTVTQDAGIYTSGGATSTFHLLLHLLEIHCGIALAVKIAKIFAIDMGRDKQAYFKTFQPPRHHHDELVAIAQKKIETSYQHTSTIEEMIKDIPSSRRNMVRRFKQVTGFTPIEYLQLTRIEAAKKLLEQTGQQMTEVIINSGYNDPKAFRKVFRKTVGMTPSEYREKFNAAR